MNVQELNLTYHNFITSAGISGKSTCNLLLCHGVYSACFNIKSSSSVPTLLIHQLLDYYFGSFVDVGDTFIDEVRGDIVFVRMIPFYCATYYCGTTILPVACLVDNNHKR